jgi:hypothetical protein
MEEYKEEKTHIEIDMDVYTRIDRKTGGLMCDWVDGSLADVYVYDKRGDAATIIILKKVYAYVKELCVSRIKQVWISRRHF